jgi:hypothetical protein
MGGLYLLRVKQTFSLLSGPHIQNFYRDAHRARRSSSWSLLETFVCFRQACMT